MSATRKVCLVDGRTTICGRWIGSAMAARPAPNQDFARWETLRDLPPQAQCETCRDSDAVVIGAFGSFNAAGLPHACPADILSSCLGVAAFHSTASGPLLAAAIAGDVEAAAVLVDAIQERGAVEVDWPVIEEHEHTWLPWRSGDEQRAARHINSRPTFVHVHRCTCGVFEHEHDATPPPCMMRGCQRERGHRGLHRREVIDGPGGFGTAIDEWGDVDPVAIADAVPWLWE